MKGLEGLDGYLTLLDASALPPLQRQLLSALHSGAFMTGYEHAKYDEEKMPFCSLCGCEDDRLRWLVCSRFQHLRDAIPDWQPDNLELPDCTLHHLLVPRQRCLVEWRSLLLVPREHGKGFLVRPPRTGYHHLFVDGSCTSDTHPVLNLAAWGIVNAIMEKQLRLRHWRA